MNHGNRKFDALDVVNMFATMSKKHWEVCLHRCYSTGNIDKLMGYRYGLQAGLTDAISKGVRDKNLDLWVIKRCRDCEKIAKLIFRKKYPNPLDDTEVKKDRLEYIHQAKMAKRKRDKELEMFFMRSNF